MKPSEKNEFIRKDNEFLRKENEALKSKIKILEVRLITQENKSIEQDAIIKNLLSQRNKHIIKKILLGLQDFNALHEFREETFSTKWFEISKYEKNTQ